MSLGRLIGGIAGNFIPGVGPLLGMAFGGAAEEALGGGESGAARRAGEAANAAADRELALRRQMYEEGVARQKPFYEAGVNALPGYLSGIGPGGELVRGFTMADYQADPGYGFRLAEGQKALERSAAARAGLQSGSALRAAARYGQEMGSQEFSNAYQRFRDTQGLRRNALAGVVGYGPTSANAMTSSGQNYAAGAGPVISGQGETTANALLAAQRARGSAYGQVGSALGKYLGGGGYTGLGGYGEGYTGDVAGWGQNY